MLLHGDLLRHTFRRDSFTQNNGTAEPMRWGVLVSTRDKINVNYCQHLMHSIEHYGCMYYVAHLFVNVHTTRKPQHI